jgi:hypothetical protein
MAIAIIQQLVPFSPKHATNNMQKFHPIGLFRASTEEETSRNLVRKSSARCFGFLFKF